jgi:hypothetical protein
MLALRPDGASRAAGCAVNAVRATARTEAATATAVQCGLDRWILDSALGSVTSVALLLGASGLAQQPGCSPPPGGVPAA